MTEEMSIEKPALPKTSELLKTTFSWYKENIKICLTLFLAPFILVAAGGIISSILSTYYKGLTSPFTITFHILGSLLGFIGIISTIFATISLIQYLEEKEQGGTFGGLRNSFEKARKLFFPILWVSILVSFVEFGGYMLFIIPGIILTIYLCFSNFILIIEGKRGIRALTGSYQYARGYAWSIFVKFFFFVLALLPLMLVILGIIFLVTYRIGGVSGFLHGVDALRHPTLIFLQLLWQFVESIFIAPLFLVYLYFIYREIRKINSFAADEVREKKLKKWMIILPILGIVLFGAGVISLVTLVSLNKTRRELAPIQAALASPFLSFSDSKHGASFQYPKTWERQEVENENVIGIIESPKDALGFWDRIEILYFKLDSKQKAMTLADYKKDFENTYKDAPDTRLIKIEDTTLSGNPAFEVEVEQEALDMAGTNKITVVSKQVFSIKNGAMYGVFYTYKKGEKSESHSLRETLFKKVLESIKIK